MNKIIEKAKHRVGKIDNMTRKPEELQADVDHIHLLLAQVSTETEKNYGNAAFERAREVRREVDEKIKNATEGLAQPLHARAAVSGGL